MTYSIIQIFHKYNIINKHKLDNIEYSTGTQIEIE